jgi:hypothetical protein
MIGRRGFLLGSAAVAGVLALPARANQPENLFTGGLDGRIIRVTTLDPEGPGSFTEAVKAKGPRIVVFEVGGVIDLALKSVKISNGDLTIAGQTAPSLVTFIRGGIEIGQGARNVVVEHIAVRPGEAGQAKKSGWECDGIYAYGASRVRVRNCSITWATDEGLSASGKRFGEDNASGTVEDWRAHTSNRIHFANNIVAEGLSNSTHSKGEHSKGTLIHDNVTAAMIADSLYAHNRERNVLFKGGAQGWMNGNVVYNAGKRFAHYNLHKGEWGQHKFVKGHLHISDNVFLGGPSTDHKVAAFMLGGDGPLDLDIRGNLALKADGSPMETTGRFGAATPLLTLQAHRYVDRTAELRAHMETVLDTCGARPWERDPIDARIVDDVRNGTGRIIDSEQDVGGYPVRPETRAAFVESEWNLATMTRKT